MVFWIDSTVRFRPEDGCLWSYEDESSAIVLTLTMKRLLTLLLEMRGHTLTRDKLLECVWDANGLRSSGHTLNKYISELRKYLTQLGMRRECIITIPRIGFMFNADIDVQFLLSEASKAAAQIPAISSQKQDHAGKCKYGFADKVSNFARYASIKSSMFILSIAAMGILLTAGGYLLSQSVVTNREDIPRYFLFNYQSCPVYTVQKNSVALSEKKKKLFLELAAEENILCLSGTSFLYQASESYIFGKKGRAFISSCTSDENSYLSCLNYYWSGHESNDEN
ncbi:winged helix-turn-helix domain-containing protein [Enterobacter chuandaensis]|uniref:winged helix-turn-helix domain-containing protein n=1 Tax=Enterobacter chuandaensis TaxID=2497875 RepID=UPI003D6F6128